MEHFKAAFDILIERVRKSGNFYMTFFALFLYQNMFDDHLKCSCGHGIVKQYITVAHCIYYLVFPALILFLLTLWMDAEFQRVLRIACRCRCNLFGRLLGIMLKAGSIALLWVVSVLLDGDWYVCCKSTEHTCGSTTTYQKVLEEQTNFKRDSMAYGSGLVLFLLFGHSILTAFPWWDICCRSCKGVRPYPTALFEEIIREETDILIEKDLKRTAQECVVIKSRELLPPFPNAAQRNTQGGGGSTHPEVEDRVITLNNLDFNIISDLDNGIINKIMTSLQPSSEQSNTETQTQRQQRTQTDSEFESTKTKDIELTCMKKTDGGY